VAPLHPCPARLDAFANGIVERAERYLFLFFEQN